MALWTRTSTSFACLARRASPRVVPRESDRAAAVVDAIAVGSIDGVVVHRERRHAQVAAFENERRLVAWNLDDPHVGAPSTSGR